MAGDVAAEDTHISNLYPYDLLEIPEDTYDFKMRKPGGPAGYSSRSQVSNDDVSL